MAAAAAVVVVVDITHSVMANKTRGEYEYTELWGIYERRNTEKWRVRSLFAIELWYHLL